jgi:hypothetical protein
MDPLSEFVASYGSMLSWSGLGAFIILCVVRGWLIPKATFIQQVKILTDRIAELKEERDGWKDSAQTWETVARTEQAQARELLDQNKTTLHALGSIRESLDRVTGGEK